MSSIGVSVIVFGCVFAGALFGMFLRHVLPDHQLSAESKDVVKLGMGLVATMAALVLGLLVSSAKAHYDIQSDELMHLSAKVVLLDHVLAHYGPETKDARGLLRRSVSEVLDRMWSKERAGAAPSASPSDGAGIILDRIQELAPKDDRQRALVAQAVSLTMELGGMRWLQYVQGAASSTISLPFFLVFWLSLIFTSFGLFAPVSGPALVSLFVAALSVSSALLLVLELDTPYGGLIQLPSAPLRNALAHLGN